MEPRFVLMHLGKTQVGKPVRDVRTALQRGYDLLADLDWQNLSKLEKEKARYTIEER